MHSDAGLARYIGFEFDGHLFFHHIVFLQFKITVKNNNLIHICCNQNLKLL